MEGKIIMSVVLLITAAAIIFALGGCTNVQETPPPTVTEFSIYFSYGVGEKNIIDTDNNTYTKDMVCDPQKEYSLDLTREEKKEIYAAIIENDMYSDSYDFTENCNIKGCQQITPLSSATIRIRFGEAITETHWKANYINPDNPDVKKFLDMRDRIIKVIRNKEKEMGIEQPKCVYV